MPDIDPAYTHGYRPVIATDLGVRVDTDDGWSGIAARTPMACRELATAFEGMATELEQRPDILARWADLPEEVAPEPLGWMAFAQEDGELMPTSTVFANPAAAERFAKDMRRSRYRPLVAVLYPADAPLYREEVRERPGTGQPAQAPLEVPGGIPTEPGSALPATMLWPSDFDIEPDERGTPVRFVDAPEDDDPEERAEQAAVTEAMMPLQAESMANRDEDDWDHEDDELGQLVDELHDEGR